MSSVNNWRTALSWPEHVSLDKDYAVEYLYEDADSKTHSDFSHENALAAMLLSRAVCLNSNWYKDEWPDDVKKLTSINVITNDIFAWGVADAEPIAYAEIAQVYRYWVKDHVWGTAVWAIIRNREMPQKPVEKSIRKAGIWDLDALKTEHNLRANHYDGVSGVLARRKRAAYVDWCVGRGYSPLPYDGNWWEGWKEYIAAHPGWYDEAWQAQDKRNVDDWAITNGFGDGHGG